jgi:hypothetical protein
VSNNLPVITISIEVELGWGSHFQQNPNYKSIISENREAETSILNSLVKLCDNLEIPVTFDFVGHLFLDECDGKHDGPYNADWFSCDKITSNGRLFYAPDLVEVVKSSSIDHEVATHTFSHVLFDRVNEDVADRELQLAKEVHNQAGLPSPSSLVAPQHKRPPLNVIQDHGIDTIRSPDQNAKRGNWPIQSLNVIQRSNIIREPELKNDILHSYCTPWPSLTTAMLPNGQRSVGYPLKSIPIASRKFLHKRKLRQALQEAVSAESHLHLWTHLYNMANEDQWDVISGFLKSLANHQEEKELNVSTMSNIDQIT